MVDEAIDEARLDHRGPAEPVGVAPSRVAGPAALATRLAVAAIALGVALRAGSRSDLWLDEVLSLNISAVPLGQLDDALRQDGAPPLYYLLLRGWTGLFGDGAVAARSLSALFSLGALPLAWFAGRRLGGRATAWHAVLLFATSPFAIRYATEVRMYALVQLLALAGHLLLWRAFERPTRERLIPLALVAGALPLTHYWTLFLLAAAALALLVVRRDDRHRRAATRCLGALAAGGLLFVPWTSSFLFQLRHTGNPWDPPAELGRGVLIAFLHFGGSLQLTKLTVGSLVAALVVAAVAAHRLRAWWPERATPSLRSMPSLPWQWRPGMLEAAIGVGGLALGMVASGAVGAAFASRYASPMFPLILLAAAVGVGTLPSLRLRHGVLAALVVAGLIGGSYNVGFSRTQAGEVVAAITAEAEPGDVVAFCPDQLGPAVNRMLPDWLHQLTYPYGGSAERVNWVDYADRNERADPAVFARYVDAVAGPRHTVWLVWREGYRTFGGGCERTATALRLLRPGSTVEVTPASGGFETHYVTRLPGTAQ